MDSHRSTEKFVPDNRHRVLISACPFSVGSVNMLTLEFGSADEALVAVKAVNAANAEEHPNYFQTAIYLGSLQKDPEEILPSIY